MAVKIDSVSVRVINSEIDLYEAFASMYSRRHKRCMTTVISCGGISIMPFQHDFHNSGVLVREPWTVKLGFLDLAWKRGGLSIPGAL